MMLLSAPVNDHAITYLWSKRFSPARGWHWRQERDCLPNTASQWLDIFQRDEPGVEFILSDEKPREA